MPARNVVKSYLPNSIYHSYNRGVEKRIIFSDDQDYKVFLNYLKEYLSPQEKMEQKEFTLKGDTFKGVPKPIKNYSNEIELLSFSLMPNHFHLLIKQKGKDSIKKFMQSLLTRYSMYFNKRHGRIGALFQGAYKATNVINKDYLLDVSRYIHLNKSNYSSYLNYIGVNHTLWIKTHYVLDYFKESKFINQNKIRSYRYFVEEFKYQDEKSFDLEG